MCNTKLLKFTGETRATIVEAIRVGANINRAAELAGVRRMTLWRWLQQGSADEEHGLDTDYARFARNVREAESQVVSIVEQSVVKTAVSGNDWRAGAWWLSKRRPNEFGDAKRGLKAELVEALLGHLRQTISPDAFREVLQACGTFEAPRRVIAATTSPNEDSA